MPAAPTSPAAPSWPDDIFAALRSLDVRMVAYVPDAGHIRLIERCQAEAAMIAVPLTTEEEGVALLAGAWLGGLRGALLMQSSGVGNCVNMLSLTRTCRLPLLILATMRGEDGESNPWQLPMGRIAGEILGLAGVAVSRVDTAADAGPVVAEAGRMVFDGPSAERPDLDSTGLDSTSAAAVLIGQRLIGVKTFTDDQ